METIMATVLIMVIFILSSMILNNLFSNTIKNDTRGIEARLNALHYLCINDKVNLPHYEEFNSWEISVLSDQFDEYSILLFEAVNKDTGKTLDFHVYD